MNTTKTTERKPGTLRLPPSRRTVPTTTRLRTRRFPLPVYAAILLVLPVAVLAGARSSGWWITSGHTVPASALGSRALGVDATAGNGRGAGGEGVGAVAQSGGAGEQSGGAGAPSAASEPGGAGALDPQEVKGSMTLRQILDAFPGVTAAEVCGKFGVPPTRRPPRNSRRLPSKAVATRSPSCGNGWRPASMAGDRRRSPKRPKYTPGLLLYGVWRGRANGIAAVGPGAAGRRHRCGGSGGTPRRRVVSGSARYWRR